MNILVVHEVDWLNKVVYEIHNLSEILSKNHKVFAIDYEEKWRKEGFFDMGTLKTREFRHVSRAYNGANVTVRRPGMIKLPLLSRLFAFFTHYYEIQKTIKEEKIDVIVLYSAPTNGLQTIKLAKKYGIPVIFRSIDILHMLVSNKILRWMTFFLEKKVYSRVDKILALTPKLSEYVIRMSADKKKVELLPPGVDTKMFYPVLDNELRYRVSISDNDKVIVFIGTLDELTGMDLFLKQFPKILKETPNTKLVIVGGGPLLKKLKSISNNLNLNDNVIFTDFQPYEFMPHYINLADVCINPFLINDTTRDIIPTKILQYLACAKPVLATPLPGMKAILPNEDYGVIYSNIDDFAENTVKILKDDKKMRTVGEKGLMYVKKNHDWNGIAQRLEEVLIYEVQSRE